MVGVGSEVAAYLEPMSEPHGVVTGTGGNLRPVTKRIRLILLLFQLLFDSSDLLGRIRNRCPGALE